MNRKRFNIIVIVLVIILVMAAALLSGCGQGAEIPAEQTATGEAEGTEAAVMSERFSVVCTVFPQYDWVRQIVGDQTENVDVALLLTDQTDLHSYQPTVEDITKIADCDLFVYVGGESDKWVEDALREATNQDMIVVNLLETLGDKVKEEELLEGMEAEKGGKIAGGEEAQMDEHVWLSLKNARALCTALCDSLTALDADNAAVYQANLAGYLEKLAALDTEYQTAVAAAPVKALLFGDRFPFRYMADDYGITSFAAFPGCSAETEASFETIAFLAGKTDELGLNTVMVTETADQSIARTIISNSGDPKRQILALDAMQSVGAGRIETDTYISIMESNLAVLKEALQ